MVKIAFVTTGQISRRENSEGMAHEILRQNNILGAIAAAQLVPPNSDAYAPVLHELQR